MLRLMCTNFHVIHNLTIKASRQTMATTRGSHSIRLKGLVFALFIEKLQIPGTLPCPLVGHMAAHMFSLHVCVCENFTSVLFKKKKKKKKKRKKIS